MRFSSKILFAIISVTLIAIVSAYFLGDYGSDDVETVDASHTEDIDPHAGHNHPPGEHPEDAETHDDEAIDWCAEHSVPESECTLCHPELVAHFKETGDWCAGHGIPESHCRLCNPGIEFPQEKLLREATVVSMDDEIKVSLFYRPNSDVCATDGALIQFASANTASKTGLTTQLVYVSQEETNIEAPAEVVFNETRSNVITSSVKALVSRWVVSPGDEINKGDILAILESPEIAELQAGLLKSYAAYQVEQKEFERHRELKNRNLISDQDFEREQALAEQALTDFNSHKGLLISAGMSEGDIELIIENKSVSNRFPLRAQAGGVMVQRIAQLGELMEAGKAFAMIADPRQMWIEARLTEQQIRRVKVGQALTFTSDGFGLNQVGAKIIWVSKYIDPHTRTGIVRAEVVHPDAGLHAGEFGVARISHHEGKRVVLVPKDAVQWEGCCNVVFVKESDSRYRPYKVNLVSSSGDYYQVSEGVNPGDEVVVDGSFLLKTELKKSSLGAGCCGLDPVG
ncbi:MAG: efflux RND transporter periplasmic adaptor subunit [candidate division Zixibacteria bacterium]|nr:efflux RND transporter periplasmic adaptor subunit [candidate division Zixibacteria bacterium]